MTADEKRKLRKQGKELVEKRSTAWREALARACPAPPGSEQWSKEYRIARANERWLAEQQPTHIRADEVERRFITLSADEAGTSGAYIECLDCHDLLHTYPLHSLQCSCGTVVVTYRRPPKITARGDRARVVVLIAKGTE